MYHLPPLALLIPLAVRVPALGARNVVAQARLVCVALATHVAAQPLPQPAPHRRHRQPPAPLDVARVAPEQPGRAGPAGLDKGPAALAVPAAHVGLGTWGLVALWALPRALWNGRLIGPCAREAVDVVAVCGGVEEGQGR